MYSCSTVQCCYGKEPFDSGTGYMYLPSVAESIQPECKTSERSQAEITIQYLNLVNHYVDTIFVLPDLGTGQELCTELKD